MCFGSTFFFNVFAIETFGPLGSGAGRNVIAAAFLVPIALMQGAGIPGTIQEWKWACILGVVTLALPFYLLTWGQSFVPTNVAALFFAAMPLIILPLSRIFLGVRISFRKWIGLSVGSVGLVILAGPGTFSQIGTSGQYLPQLAIFGAVLLIACGAILVRILPNAHPLKMNAGALIVAAVLSIPVMISEFPAQVPPWNAVAGLLGVAVFSTAIGQLVRFMLIRRKGPVFLAPVGYLAAIFAAVLGIVFLDEVLTSGALIAFVIVAIGLIIAHDGTGVMKKS